MLSVVLISLLLSAALMGGAAWGAWGRLPNWLEGFLLALAGGALIVSIMAELVQPAARQAGLGVVIAATLAGAVVFTAADWALSRRANSGRGGGLGLLAAILLDGVPENLALGVALIGAEPVEIAALAGAIFLSNLPEAAGGAREMLKSGRRPLAIFAIWTGAALALAGAAVLGWWSLREVGEGTLAAIMCLAAGAVVASLATEVFPQAFREDRQLSGVAVALGLMGAFALSQIGGG